MIEAINELTLKHAIKFGLTRWQPSHVRDYVQPVCSAQACPAGSPVYVAPEVLQKRYGQKADVWSAGMVAYLLLCARLPWKGDQSITTSDLYVSMGDGKSFNRKVLRRWL